MTKSPAWTGRDVDQGGTLLATFETSLYDETGKPRSDFVLGHLFCISKAGLRERAEYKPVQPILFAHLQKIYQRNAITAGFEETDWITRPVYRVPSKPIPSPHHDLHRPLSHLPYRGRLYARAAHRHLHRASIEGQSRLAYLSGDMDAPFWRLYNWISGVSSSTPFHWVLGNPQLHHRRGRRAHGGLCLGD